VVPLDVRVGGQMEAVFGRIGKKWGALDFVVHSIAFSPKEALQGHVVDVSRQGFLTTTDVSCWTFIRMAHLAEPLMHKGGTLFMMTYYGSQMVVKNYNIMGVAKAALESAVRYVATCSPMSTRSPQCSAPFSPSISLRLLYARLSREDLRAEQLRPCPDWDMLQNAS
jgi:enoyl-[acyl-carrier-protein] reductase (NADH)